MDMIQAFVEVALVASGLFFVALAFLDGRHAPRRASESEGALLPGHDRGAATLVPRTIRSTALD